MQNTLLIGVLPILQFGGQLALNVHTQTLHLIANIFSLLSTISSYKLKSISVYVCNYKLAENALYHFQHSGLGNYVVNCLVKKMSENIYISADLTLVKNNYLIKSKL